MNIFKILIPVVALGALGGCAVYPAGYDGGYGYNDAYVTTGPPVYVNGAITYGGGYGGYPGYRGYGGYNGYQNRPPGPRPFFGPRGDRDRDGIPNRFDRNPGGRGGPDGAGGRGGPGGRGGGRR